jgi:hypothetical protein
MAEITHANASGIFGIAGPALMWAIERLNFDVPHWFVWGIVVASACAVIYSIILWEHILYQTIRAKISTSETLPSIFTPTWLPILHILILLSSGSYIPLYVSSVLLHPLF